MLYDQKIPDVLFEEIDILGEASDLQTVKDKILQQIDESFNLYNITNYHIEGRRNCPIPIPRVILLLNFWRNLQP